MIGGRYYILANSHQHNLVLSDEEFTDHKLCDGCMGLISSASFYSCMHCNFFLHTACAQLPRKKRHPCHQHTLTLLSRATSESGVFHCSACFYNRHGFVYSCLECSNDFNPDVQCCLVPETLKHPGHQHPLFHALTSKKVCNAGHHPSRALSGYFACRDCDFSMCFECIILPLVARHKYDEHLLALTYVA